MLDGGVAEQNMAQKNEALQTHILKPKEAAHSMTLAFFLARGNDEVSKTIYNLIHEADPYLRVDADWEPGIAHRFRESFKYREKSGLHMSISLEAEFETAKENATYLREALDGKLVGQYTTAGYIQYLVDEMMKTDTRYMQGKGESGQRSKTNTSRVVEYIIGIGEPPRRKTIGGASEPVQQALELVQRYMDTTVYQQWLDDAAEDFAFDYQDRDDEFQRQRLRQFKEMIDLYNVTHEPKAPYPLVLKTMPEEPDE